MDEDVGVDIKIGRDPFQISQYTLEKSVFKKICLKKLNVTVKFKMVLLPSEI